MGLDMIIGDHCLDPDLLFQCIQRAMFSLLFIKIMTERHVLIDCPGILSICHINLLINAAALLC